jgi:hypothetical protein
MVYEKVWRLAQALLAIACIFIRLGTCAIARDQSE